MSKTDTRPATSHIAPFGLRMQPDLKERLDLAAREAGRSLNAEIIARLEASFGRGSSLSDLDKEFLLSLVEAIKQSRASGSSQLDLFPRPADRAATEPPQRRVGVKATQDGTEVASKSKEKA